MSDFNINQDCFTGDTIKINHIYIDSNDPNKPNPFKNQTNYIDNLHKKKTIHTNISASILTFLSNQNNILTRTGLRYINMIFLS